MENKIKSENHFNIFLKRQERMYEVALNEILKGKKRSHWMWYIFPQLRGLAKSRKSYVFGIVDVDEAKKYLEHSVLGPRLIACCQAILKHKDKTALEILGDIDELKLRSSMTLFKHVSEENSVFHKVLEQFYDGKTDQITEGFISGEIIDNTPQKCLVGGEMPQDK